MIELLSPGPYATVQDLGRPGYAHLGVPRSGAADEPSLRLANRLLGNPESHAAVEVTYGGARLRFTAAAWVAVTGAPCPLRLAGRAADMYAPLWAPAGAELLLGRPARGLRSYVAVRGGVATEPVLGSRSADSLSGLGPPPLRAGEPLPVGPVAGLGPITVDAAPPLALPAVPVLDVIPGPRDDWFTAEAARRLYGEPYEVSQQSNRVGVRLRGPVLRRAREGEIPSEGMATGAVQVPPDGHPIVFLTDHPPTGGYPVIAVLTARSVALAAQLRPGDLVRFRPLSASLTGPAAR
ncbi:biotin-dependent carboxyltransferase family protein [Spongiactinospora sp. TRM90649]|uniref:5-oxoprolinase subunit C family protein n=1 Tax=Spongiactinospora sp. TRM90649 TaxID=3031114 RepID=UPI0023F7F7CE|nr:biotin-dependent carboxyltransferase family protein [Spongiactinospora sp. TRM90649]MDF5755382.1 biotin-dependent carboxyltransferase family protein [Spongiactinospora sp. TRM90649]